MIKSRVIFNGGDDDDDDDDTELGAALPPLHDQTTASAVLVTSDNITRQAVNNSFVSETGLRLLVGVFPVRVVTKFHCNLNKLSTSELRDVLILPDNRFGSMAPYLDLVL